MEAWRSDGFIGDTEVGYRIEAGDFAYLREGKRQRIKLEDVRLIARRYCPEHVPFVDAQEWVLALLAAGADLDAAGEDGRTAQQNLDEVGVESLLKAAEKARRARR